ncbi:MAG: hypothetical protein A2086_05540 [Spirochaetes bacterium GWD1_27_9]|nr:MAG: hypothetical protein A2Z98_16630 [Spirochaetes bacterium GWB1_27_13]OHD21875.1 MAG: hypothetical protein A2Y34_09545 [Spirochaetes bacterium GWC1_27_15]OHD37834.1 MAG: hypothetical protein A2086_05540 [Spirochaetes bacterium GWD1_27_9]
MKNKDDLLKDLLKIQTEIRKVDPQFTYNYDYQYQENLKNKYKVIMEYSNDAIFLIDVKSGNLIDINKKGEELLDIQKKDIIGQHYSKFHPNTPNFNQFFDYFKDKKEESKTIENIFTTKDGRKIPIEISFSIFNLEDQDVIFAIIKDISDRKKAINTEIYLDNFERHLINISSKFINISYEELDETINESLKIIGEFCNVDRSYVFLTSDNKQTISNTHEWCNKGIYPEKENSQNMPIDVISNLMESFLKKEHYYIPSVDNLPSEKEILKKVLKSLSLKSLITVPMLIKDEFFGFIGFDSIKDEKKWSLGDISLLKIVADIFVNTMERCKIDKELKLKAEYLKKSEEIANIGSWYWDIEKDFYSASDVTYKIYGYKNESTLNRNTTIELIIPEDRYIFEKETYEVFAKIKPCLDLVYRIKLKDTGEIRHIHSKANVEFNKDGKPIKMIGISQDITEQIKAETQKIKVKECEANKIIVEGLTKNLNNTFSQIEKILTNLNLRGDLNNNSLEKIQNLTSAGKKDILKLFAVLQEPKND